MAVVPLRAGGTPSPWISLRFQSTAEPDKLVAEEQDEEIDFAD